MTWVAYAIGALAASPDGEVFGTAVFWLGYLCLFLLEVATVLVNEVVDLPTDRHNRFFSPMTGGSRVLVDGSLSLREARIGIAASLLGFLAAAIWLVPASAAAPVAVAGVLGVLAVLAIGYTAPPLKLSYRSLGEADVALTHSIGVLLCGYVFMGGAWNDPMPWLLSVPLLLAIVPSITLAGIPDLQADALASKRTLAVRLGPTGALRAALVFTLLAAAAAVAWQVFGIADGAYTGIVWPVLPHSVLLAWLIYRQIKNGVAPGRIDSLMMASLGYVLWFGMTPLVGLALR